MAASVNKVILIGNLGRDPEIRFNSDGGNKIVTLSVATSESWKDKTSGERRDRTEWHKVVVFNEKLSEICEKYLKKGSKLYLEGQLQTRKWTDKQGQDRYTTEIILAKYKGEITLLSSNSGESEQDISENSSGLNKSLGNNVLGETKMFLDYLNDDVPF